MTKVWVYYWASGDNLGISDVKYIALRSDHCRNYDIDLGYGYRLEINLPESWYALTEESEPIYVTVYALDKIKYQYMVQWTGTRWIKMWNTTERPDVFSFDFKETKEEEYIAIECDGYSYDGYHHCCASGYIKATIEIGFWADKLTEDKPPCYPKAVLIKKEGSWQYCPIVELSNGGAPEGCWEVTGAYYYVIYFPDSKVLVFRWSKYPREVSDEIEFAGHSYRVWVKVQGSCYVCGKHLSSCGREIKAWVDGNLVYHYRKWYDSSNCKWHRETYVDEGIFKIEQVEYYGNKMWVKAKFKGVPSENKVYIDGNYVGDTQDGMIVVELPAGTHHLKIDTPYGFSNPEMTFNVESDSTIKIKRDILMPNWR